MRSNFIGKFAAAFFCLVIGTLGASQLAAQGEIKSPEELFRSGVNSYQKNEFDQARTQFSEVLKLAPNNIHALYNLGMTEYKAKNEGLALGLWRKALAADPTNDQVAHAIAYAENALPQRAVARGSDLFESFRREFLVRHSLLGFFVINLILLSFAGWILIRYFAARTKSIENEEPSPALPYIGIIFAFFFVLSSGLVAAKIYDLSQSRATVTAEKVEVKTSPDASSATLFELFEGLEVVVRQFSGDWVQVYYPGGLSGWVPTSSLYLTSGRQP